ncbi:MAG: nucleoside triphosphate pyrophosphohydrolase [Thermoplasmata archaeon]
MGKEFDELVQLMARLRAPDGCPWDRKQTHASLKPYLLEEAYEVLETIDEGDVLKLKEELGDLLLQIVFHAQIGTETGTFTIQEVITLLADKLVRRHPHVFGQAGEGAEPLDADQVYSRWEEIKRAERNQPGREGSALDGVPKNLPALLRAYQVQGRASRVGFDWPHTSAGFEQLCGKIDEEVMELRQARVAREDSTSRDGQAQRDARVEEELGDVLFSLDNLARSLTVNPEDALRKAVNRFITRFHYIESQAAKSGRKFEDMSLSEMDRLWKEAKSQSSTERSP